MAGVVYWGNRWEDNSWTETQAKTAFETYFDGLVAASGYSNKYIYADHLLCNPGDDYVTNTNYCIPR